MTNQQYEEYALLLSFEDTLNEITKRIEAINNQCGGNSKVGYGVEWVKALKRDLLKQVEIHRASNDKRKELV